MQIFSNFGLENTFDKDSYRCMKMRIDYDSSKFP